jgi:hypothetical protein
MLTELHDNTHLAEAFLVMSLDVCAHDHDLSPRVLDVVKNTCGRLQVIFDDWFDPNSADRFDALPRKPAGTLRNKHENAHVEMGRFVVDFHHRVRDALTVAENWSADAATPINRFPELSAADREKYTMPAEDRVLIHGQRDSFDCVAGPDVILHDAEFIVRPTGPFQTGICTTCPHVPPWGSSVDDAFVDALVANLRHVFVPVFDTSGYLIWTPQD